MSLSAREQQALDSIKDGLAGSDPTLVARLTIFTRLASDEEMPTREKIQAGSRQAVRRSRHEPPHTRRADQRLGLLQAVPLLLWLVTTVALITVALASNRGSQGTCTGSWATLCTAGTSAANSPAGIPRTGPGLGRLLSAAVCEARTCQAKPGRSRHDHLDAERPRHHARAVTTAMTATRAMSMYSR